MPVIGIAIKEINAKKYEDIVGAMKVNNNTNLKDLKERDLPALNQKGLAVEFDFKTQYISDKNKKIAEILMNGEVIVMEKNQDKILKEWKKDKKLPDDINIEVLNTILRRCVTKALGLSEELNLPPPIAMPFASKKAPEESRYIG